MIRNRNPRGSTCSGTKIEIPILGVNIRRNVSRIKRLKALYPSEIIPDSGGQHAPDLTYLIEIKIDGEQKKIEFFTFYPSQSFAENMMEYKNIEKLILTSFPPLLEKLKNDQQFYNNRLNYEY
jgi:hypothetical protein